MSEAAVEAQGVRVRFGQDVVLDGIDLRVDAGDFVGILGPNGAGKSTLLRALLGLVPLAGGEVRLLGEPLRGLGDRARIGYVPQHAGHIDPAFPATALEVVLLGRVGRRGLLRRLTRADRAAALKALDDVGLSDQARDRVGTLSGGQRQRVLLAKALAGEPQLLFLDEPTSSVDPSAREHFLALLDKLNHDRGLTLVVVSHDAEAMLHSAHRLVVLNRRVLYDGSAAQAEEDQVLHRLFAAPVHFSAKEATHAARD